MKEDPFVRGSSDAFSHDSYQHLPDEVLDEIEKAIGESLTPQASDFPLEERVVEETDGIAVDLGTQQMQETFLEISRNVLNPVERYVKAISLGESAREVFELCELVVTPLIPKVETVGLSEHAEELKFFQSLLLFALGENDSSEAEAMKEVVMEGFIRLSESFGLEYRGYRLAVRNLVTFYRSLRRDDKISESDIRKFFAIGIPSLTWVRRTKVEELVSLSGIAADSMAEIRKLACLYQSQVPKNSSKLIRSATHAPRLAPNYRKDDFQPVVDRDVLDASVEDVRASLSTIRGQA